LPIRKNYLFETQVDGLAVWQLVIGHNFKGGEKSKGQEVPEEEPPGPISRKECSCDIMLEYDCKVCAHILSPEVLMFTAWEYIVRISKLWYTIHKQRL